MSPIITQTESTTLLRKTHPRCGLFLPSRTRQPLFHSHASVAYIIDTTGGRLPEAVSSWMQNLSSLHGSVSDAAVETAVLDFSLLQLMGNSSSPGRANPGRWAFGDGQGQLYDQPLPLFKHRKNRSHLLQIHHQPGWFGSLSGSKQLQCWVSLSALF